MDYLTSEDVRTILRRRCEYPATQKSTAKELGVSLSYINQVLRGQREPAGKLLDALGLRRFMGYIKVRRK